MNELNINKFFEGLARALTVQFEKEYPGLAVKVKDIRPKENFSEGKAVRDGAA